MECLTVRKIGLLGGTFDPPHLGHLIMAEEARIQMNLDEIWWLPNKIPPHKNNRSNSTEKDRLHMVNMMIQLHEKYFLCDVELRREGPSYTIDTINYLQETYPNDTFYFIIGEDSLQTLHTWKDSEQLQKIISFIVMPRPGYGNDTKNTNAKIMKLSSQSFDISSTNIRNRIKENKLNRFLLTKEVFDYIKEKGLYE